MIRHISYQSKECRWPQRSESGLPRLTTLIPFQSHFLFLSSNNIQMITPLELLPDWNWSVQKYFFVSYRIMTMGTLSWILQSCSSSFSTTKQPFRWTLTLKRRTTACSGSNTHTQSYRTSVHMYTTDQKYGVSKNLIKKKTLTLFQILNFLIIKLFQKM